MEQGNALLEKGFPVEALQQFEQCLAIDTLCAAAWEGCATAHKRLGRDAEAEHCEGMAKHITEKLWGQRVQAEIRAGHPLWRKK
jgi:hypothetical protein